MDKDAERYCKAIGAGNLPRKRKKEVKKKVYKYINEMKSGGYWDKLKFYYVSERFHDESKTPETTKNK